MTQTDNDVHQSLKDLNFLTPLGHLKQAVRAHTRGDWAACNSQLRTFLEGLFNEISVKLDPTAAELKTPANRRDLLAKHGFFVGDWNEWSNDGKNFINGLFKMLHTQGSHPGLSDEDQATFRLHIVLVTARLFLRRFQDDFKANSS